MAKVGSAVGAADFAIALRIERGKIAGKPLLFYGKISVAREVASVPGVARGENAVEHVDSRVNRVQNVVGRSDSHDIFRLFFGKILHGEVEH